MADTLDNAFSRRQFIKNVALTSASLSIGPYFVFGKDQSLKPMKRLMGRLGFEATTLGLGGKLRWNGLPPASIPSKLS